MNSLNRSTQRRLLSLPQLPTVWEGDRLPLDVSVATLPQGDVPTCILWVDGTAGSVRAIELASSADGPEVMVRSLLHAMEQPMDSGHGPGQRGRPSKLVVRDRELHFFLRGVLQGLEIEVEYQVELPVIDLLFEGMREMLGVDDDPALPEAYAMPLMTVLRELWTLAPWEYLQDHDVIEIQLEGLDLDGVYVSVLGRLGMEHGLLLYRSLESLRRFRQMALDYSDDMELMQSAFLEQDCLFVTYAPLDEDFDSEFEDFDLLAWEDLAPDLGSIHPLEGVRSQLDEDEALTLLVALQALAQFLGKRRRSLGQSFMAYRDRIEVQLTLPQATSGHYSVEVATLAALSAELSQQIEQVENPAAQSSLDSVRFADDLVPSGAIVQMEDASAELYEQMKTASVLLRPGHYRPIGELMPLLQIQTSKPKAQAIARAIDLGGGVDCISFLKGVHPLSTTPTVIIVALRFVNDKSCWHMAIDYEPGPSQSGRDRWLKLIAENQGRCSLALYSGVSGKHQGNPTLRELVMLYETEFHSSAELGIPPLTFF